MPSSWCVSAGACRVGMSRVSAPGVGATSGGGLGLGHPEEVAEAIQARRRPEVSGRVIFASVSAIVMVVPCGDVIDPAGLPDVGLVGGGAWRSD